MSRGLSHRSVSYADLAMARFRNWPLRVCRADCPPGRALALRGLQIVHFHHRDLAEVFLTRRVVHRLSATLAASGRVDLCPDGDWVQVHLDVDGDLFLLESLVSLAIQANDDPVVRPLHRTSPDCPHACSSAARRAQRPRRPALVLHGARPAS
ncbi:luciferase family protein [Actinomadura keratinilytica]|uniref:Luciferase domain-containing protein n=2 Tax=Actinomadura keratinilytica TaxID=547461 RepID=A0ABP7ZEK0_9ACTN